MLCVCYGRTPDAEWPAPLTCDRAGGREAGRALQIVYFVHYLSLYLADSIPIALMAQCQVQVYTILGMIHI